MHVIPASDPPLREQPAATAADRLEMVSRAVAHCPKLICDAREIERRGRSYTVMTLESFRHQYPGRCLVMLLGRDAFDALPQWMCWAGLFELANVVVINRPAISRQISFPDWLDGVARESSQLDLSVPSGQVVFFDVTACDVSATEIRQRRLERRPVDHMVPPSVLSYIKMKGLYV